MRTRHLTLVLVPLFLAFLVGAAPAKAQSVTAMGKLRITVNPKQAYVLSTVKPCAMEVRRSTFLLASTR
jgi:hypothetical protein